MATQLVHLLIMGMRKKLRKEIPPGNKLELHLQAWDLVQNRIPNNTKMHERNFEFISGLINDMLSTVCAPNPIVDINSFDHHEIKSLINREPIRGMLERACTPMRDESLSSMRKSMNAENN